MSLLTAHELAEVLRVSLSSIYQRAKSREIPHYKLGDRLIFDRDEVLAALRQPANAVLENLKLAASTSGRGR